MSRRVVDVALLFEKAVRELDVACALKVILERRHGLTMEIVQQNYPESWILRELHPDLVVLPFCYQERSHNRFLLRWRHATFVNLTWEQLFYPGNARAKTPRGTFALQHVIHNSWSDAYATLLRTLGVPAGHIFKSGNPAYALYCEPYRRYFKERADLASGYGLDQTRRWIFFPENYNWAFYEEAMLKQMVRDGQPADQVAALRDIVTESFEAAMRWCADLVRTENVQLIIRPRPSTPADLFALRVRAVLGDLPAAMAIVPDESVREWILASDVVVSSYSTSLIEAAVAGKPAYIVEPVPWPDELHQAWHDLAPRLTTRAAFAETASRAADPAHAAALGVWAHETLMQDDAILLIADELARIRRGQAPRPKRAPWRSITLPNKRQLPDWAVYAYRRYLRPRWQRTPERVADEYLPDLAAAATIPARVQRWRSVLDPYLASLPAPSDKT